MNNKDFADTTSHQIIRSIDQSDLLYRDLKKQLISGNIQKIAQATKEYTLNTLKSGGLIILLIGKALLKAPLIPLVAYRQYQFMQFKSDTTSRPPAISALPSAKRLAAKYAAGHKVVGKQATG